MLFSRRFIGVVLIILLGMPVLLGAHLHAQAGSEGEDQIPTALGEPVSTGDAETSEISSQQEQDELPDYPLAGLELLSYLPIISNHSLVPEAQRVVDLVNAERTAAGCDPLLVSVQLTAAAQGHSEDMALNDFFSHTSSDGRSPWDRIQETGYRYSAAAENIAAGYMSPESAVAAWMNSSGHRANILNCRLEQTGVGYFYLPNDTGQVNYRRYWTQDFATPLD